LDPITTSSIATGPNNCFDFYFEVEITRDANAYDHTREYHIEVSSSETSTISTPTPREIYVEHLISQSRNSTTDVLLDTVSIAPGGTMTLMLGETYDIELVGSTATNGYEQIESYINFPNTIFQINSVASTYAANGGTDPDAATKVYADGCGWENDPNSPNYRSCLSTGKYGGDITVNYNVTIIGGAGTSEMLNTLIYDFSGSSYHYNSDFSVAGRIAQIVNASITKAFSPKTINPGGTSTLIFTITNPGSGPITGINFSDPFPSGLSVASTPAVSYTGCGPGAFSPVLSGGETSISFSSGTVAGYGTCTIILDVTASAEDTYNNTSGNLFINSATDTGSFATDILVVTSKPPAPSSCVPRTTMATWSLENYTASSSTNSGPFDASSHAIDVGTSVGTYGAVTGSSSGIANPTTFPTGWDEPSTTGNSGNSWGIQGGWLSSNPADPTIATTPYFQFQIDASQYGGIGITASYNLQQNWSNAGNWYVLFSTDGTNWSAVNNAVWSKADSWQLSGITGTTTSTGNPIVYFRVFAAGAQYTGPSPQTTHAELYLDDIVITGCPRPDAPTLSKAFSPSSIPQGTTSTLTFNFTNPNASSLAGVSFSDTLPAGLLIHSPNGLTPINCTTGSILTAPTITASVGTSTISMSGAELSANASCGFSVDVQGVVAGQYTNISDNITATDTGPNTTEDGYGEDDLTVIAPPVISKSFGANSILTGNTTSLTFSINNPNIATTLTGVQFTDVLPAGVDVGNSASTECGGGTTGHDHVEWWEPECW
jgi:uncharacterized repeat protein (TIGR01451 family)